MRFLLDQDVYAVTARHLIGRGHDVVTAGELGLSRSDDTVILQAAAQDSRLLITRDRDYGELVFVRGAPTGVLHLKITHTTVVAVHSELDRVLNIQPEASLRQAFVVIEPGRHRVRRCPPENSLKPASTEERTKRD